MEYIQREITPIGEEDLFIVLNHPHAKFDYAAHFHSDYEINMVINGKGKRIVGDCVAPFSDIDLVMVGPNIPHRWISESDHDEAHVVTIQFHKETLEYPIINKKIFYPIKQLFTDSSYGIEFSQETSLALKDTILNLSHKELILPLSFSKYYIICLYLKTKNYCWQPTTREISPSENRKAEESIK